MPAHRSPDPKSSNIASPDDLATQIATGSSPDRPQETIRLEDGRLDRAVEAAARAIAMDVYLRGGQLCWVAPPNERAAAAKDGEAMLAALKPVERDWLRYNLVRRARFQRFDGRCREGVRDVNPPVDVAAALIAAADSMPFRHLRGLVHAPLVRPDGSVIDRPGYDPATGLYFDHPSRLFEGANLEPGREEAEEAARTLGELIDSFPFVDDADRTVALSAILTTLQRPVLPTAMMHVFDSPTPGTGKTKLTALASAIGTGAWAAVMSVSANEEETNKRLDGVILAGSPVLVLDNIDGALGGDKLCSLLSEPTVMVRPLGGSAMAQVPVTTTVMATGNNIRLKGDVTRRASIARLDAKVERPELRSFDHDPVAEALENRWDLVRAALTIVLAYHRAGCPRVASPLDSFEAWCRMVRDPLIWAGCADPTATMERLRDDDPLDDLGALLEAWVSRFDDAPQLVADVVRSAATDTGELADALESVAGVRGEINKRRLGQYLRRHVDRVVRGRRIVSDGRRQGSTLWRVVSAT